MFHDKWIRVKSEKKRFKKVLFEGLFVTLLTA